jgi:hypothetical protein
VCSDLYVLHVYGEDFEYGGLQFQLGEKWHVGHVMSGMLAGAVAARGSQWALSAVIARPRPHIFSQTLLPGAAPDTWLVPLCSPSHWALLVARPPTSSRYAWDVALLDSLAGSGMLARARESATLLAGHLQLDADALASTLRQVHVQPQDASWQWHA